MKKTHKRYFTLLEALIAALLAIAVLTALGYFYRQMDQINSLTENLQKESFEQRYVEGRLSAVLTRAVSERDKKKDFLFMTVTDHGGLFHKEGSKSLLFVYDNLVDLNGAYSNHVLGRLYLDTKGNLCLATWPSWKRWESGVNPPVKNEILMTHVVSLSFSFFIPPDKNWKLPTPKPTEPTPNPTPPPIVSFKPEPEGDWIADWQQEYKMLPGIIRVEVKRLVITTNKGLPIESEETIRYAFPLIETSRQIVYTQ